MARKTMTVTFADASQLSLFAYGSGLAYEDTPNMGRLLQMKIAHSVVITPGRCGLYETTRELVTGLRALGIDSRMVDPTFKTNQLFPAGETDDRGALFASEKWAASADVFANHSGLSEGLERLDKRVIHVAHGRPRSSFLQGLRGVPVYGYQYAKDKDPNFTDVVTFWPSHVPYLEVMWPDTPITCVRAPVDLDAWTPDGPSGYKFGGHGGVTNVVVTDAWREDIDPFTCLNAFALWAREYDQKAKLHIYGAPTRDKRIMAAWNPLLRTIQDQDNLGEIKPWVRGLAHVYRAADMLISPNNIDTRSVREAMACGCPVARMPAYDIRGLVDSMTAEIARHRSDVRRDAECLFDPEDTAREFLAVADKGNTRTLEAAE